jgi:hypothetical protein
MAIQDDQAFEAVADEVFQHAAEQIQIHTNNSRLKHLHK